MTKDRVKKKEKEIIYVVSNLCPVLLRVAARCLLLGGFAMANKNFEVNRNTF